MQFDNLAVRSFSYIPIADTFDDVGATIRYFRKVIGGQRSRSPEQILGQALRRIAACVMTAY